VFDYIEMFYNPGAQACQERDVLSRGVRAAADFESGRRPENKGLFNLSDSNGVVALPGSFVTTGGVTLPLTYTGRSTTLFDATLHYDVPSWRFAINGDNLFDKSYAGRCTGEVSCFFGQSHQVLETAAKAF
jgi:outer membrane receptor protein involved in Fe transport